MNRFIASDLLHQQSAGGERSVICWAFLRENVSQVKDLPFPRREVAQE